jgi:hypothetical protein
MPLQVTRLPAAQSIRLSESIHLKEVKKMDVCNTCKGTGTCQACKGKNQRCGCGVWDAIKGVLVGSRAGKCSSCRGTGKA